MSLWLREKIQTLLRKITANGRGRASPHPCKCPATLFPFIMATTEKIIAAEDLPAWRSRMRAENRRVVVTNGVFDLMHRGHATYLEQAAALGDCLLVLVNDDASVTALKGPSRPIVSEQDRAAMVAALECVGAVSVFHGPVAADALRAAAPDVYVKGGDYTVDSLNRDEFAALQACGAQIKILPLVPGCSTSNIVKKILTPQTLFGNTGKAATLDERLAPIFGRRSVREFLPRAVEQREIAALLEAAMAAPSARAAYPAEFIVLDDPDVRKGIAEFLPNGSFLAKAPLGFVVCGDLSRACHGELSYMIQDCSACVENLLIAAHLLGLGACWLGVHPNAARVENIRKFFHLPENIIPISAVAVGWPSKNPPPRTSYNADQVHLNAW